MRHVRAPDFPTGGIIVGRVGVVEAYRTGRGRVVVRGRAHNEPLKGGSQRHRLHRAALPGQQGRAHHARWPTSPTRRTIPEIRDLRDESGRDGVRVVVELRRDAVPRVVLNKLYKHTAVQTTFGVNAIALVDGVPRTLGLRDMVRPLPRPPARGGHPALALPARAGRGAGPHPRGAPEGAGAPRRGHRPHPRRGRPRRGPRRAHDGLRPHRGPGPRDPRPAPAAPHPARGGEDPGRVRRAPGAHRRAARDPRRRGARLRESSARSCSRSAGATPTSAAPRSSPARATSTSRT